MAAHDSSDGTVLKWIWRGCFDDLLVMPEEPLGRVTDPETGESVHEVALVRTINAHRAHEFELAQADAGMRQSGPPADFTMLTPRGLRTALALLCDEPSASRFRPSLQRHAAEYLRLYRHSLANFTGDEFLRVDPLVLNQLFHFE